MDLKVALNESFMALNLFLNNKFLEALDLLRPWYVNTIKIEYLLDACLILIPIHFLYKLDLNIRLNILPLTLLDIMCYSHPQEKW